MCIRACSSHQWVCIVIIYVTLCVYQCVVSTTPLLGVTCQSLLVQCLVATVLGVRVSECFLWQLRKRRLESGRTAALLHRVVSLCCWELSGVDMGGEQVH